MMLASATTSAVLAAILSGLAAALLVPSPARQLGRTRASEGSAPVTAGLLAAWRRRFAARPDAAPVRRRVGVGLAGGVAAGLGLDTVGAPAVLAWTVAPLLVLAVVVALGKLEPTAARRRRERLGADLPHALELMSACLYAGLPLRSAVGSVAESFDGPVGADLSQVLTLMNLGTSDAEAWAALSSSPEWRPAAADLARSYDSGTSTVEVLQQHARDARTRRHTAVEIKAKAVGVRSVLPLMTCFMPAFLLVGVIPTVASALLNALH